MTNPSNGVEAVLQLNASITGLAGEMGRARKRQEALSQNIWAFEITPIPFVADADGNALLDVPNLLGSRTGQAWAVHRIAITTADPTTWTQGTVTVAMNAPQGSPVAFFPSPSVETYGKGQVLLTANTKLVVSGAGLPVGQAMQFSMAGIQMSATVLADYLL